MSKVVAELSIETVTLVVELLASALALVGGVAAEVSALQNLAAHHLVLGVWFAYAGGIALFIAWTVAGEMRTQVRGESVG